MKKNILLLLFVLFWASPAPAQQATGAPGAESSQTALDLGVHPGYWLINHSGNSRAWEYDYDNSSPAGSLNFEWDPLPQRFVLEYYQLNPKDYFGTFDYSYRDVVLLNLVSRGLFHNLDHYSFGPDDPSTPLTTSTDFNPDDQYSVEDIMNRAFIRYKMPDFPLHIYAEAGDVVKKGDIQQRFMRAYSGAASRASVSRNIAWRAVEARVGVNSHLGPVEVDYSHTQKKFTGSGDKVLTDYYTAPAMAAYHNLVPDLQSTSDTVKIHTSYTGGLVAAATLSTGDNKNKDSGASTAFRNAGADLTFTPLTNLSMFVRYRHYGVNVNTPDTVPSAVAGSSDVYNVRDSIASQRNVISGIIRYRPIDRLTLKGEYSWETVLRDTWPGSYNLPAPPANSPGFWEVGHRTTKGTAALGASFRASYKLTLRANYSHTGVYNPAYDTDPTRADAARASVTWMVTRKITAFLSYGTTNEKRSKLDPPLGGGARDASRNEGLASVTVLLGKRTSLTPGYAFFQNKVKQTITYQDLTGSPVLESAVPYGDTAHVVSLAANHALSDSINLNAEGSLAYCRGNFTNSGSVDGTTGIARFSNQKIVEKTVSAGIETQHTRTIGSELRYRRLNYDDMVDNTQSGKVETILATLSMKW